MESFGLTNVPFWRNVAVFTGDAPLKDAFSTAHYWKKPHGTRMVSILLIGSGGKGGDGRIGGAAAAGGGGGGGSGGQCDTLIPSEMLPDTVAIVLSHGAEENNIHSYVGLCPAGNWKNDPNYVLSYAEAGQAGSNGGAGTGGGGGSGGSAGTANKMSLGWGFSTVLAGQNGIAGGGTVAGAALTLPVTGLLVTGGTGGGGLPAAGAGAAGGAFTVPAQPSLFMPHPGGIGGSGTTTPPTDGTSGYYLDKAGIYAYGGTGGGSTHATATGAGLVQASGGRGGYGCGGGGGGGALTGSATATGGRGGPAICIVTWW